MIEKDELLKAFRESNSDEMSDELMEENLSRLSAMLVNNDWHPGFLYFKRHSQKGIFTCSLGRDRPRFRGRMFHALISPETEEDTGLLTINKGLSEREFYKKAIRFTYHDSSFLIVSFLDKDRSVIGFFKTERRSHAVLKPESGRGEGKW